MTREHVIPRCLFVAPLPSNPVIIPVCEECNGAKSKDDDFLRDLLVIDPFAQNHPIARKILQTTLLRSAARNPATIVREVLENSQLMPFYPHGGIYLGDAYSTELDTDRLEKILFAVCKGLLFDARSLRIPDEYSVEIMRFQPREFIEVVEDFASNLHLKGPRQIGTVFWAYYVQVEEDPYSCIFLLQFYGGVGLSVTILRPDLAQQSREKREKLRFRKFGDK